MSICMGMRVWVYVWVWEYESERMNMRGWGWALVWVWGYEYTSMENQYKSMSMREWLWENEYRSRKVWVPEYEFVLLVCFCVCLFQFHVASAACGGASRHHQRASLRPGYKWVKHIINHNPACPSPHNYVSAMNEEFVIRVAEREGVWLEASYPWNLASWTCFSCWSAEERKGRCIRK